jgi:uncharacterized circularly permuted ATP-grasp superfamily protein
MFAGMLAARPHYEGLFRRLASLTAEEFRRRKVMTDLSMLQDGVGFTVYRQEEGIERVWPMDPVPPIIAAAEWRQIEQGLSASRRSTRVVQRSRHRGIPRGPARRAQVTSLREVDPIRGSCC